MRGTHLKILVSTISVFVSIIFLAGYNGCSGGGSTTTATTSPTPTATSGRAVSYASDLQPIWNANCASCHVGGGSSGSLQLDASVSYDKLLARNGRTTDHGPLVIAGNASGSALIQKLEGTQTFGSRMPLGQSPLSSSTIQKIKDWINQGASNN